MDLIKLDQFPSVPTTGTATIVTDQFKDRAVHALCFVLGGTTFTKAMMTSIEIAVDGKTVVPVITGTNLQKLNDHEGLPSATAYLWYFFGDPTAQTIRGQHLGDLDLSIYRKPLEIRVGITGATAPTLAMWALTSVPKMQMGIQFNEVEAATLRGLVRTTIQPSAAVTRASYGVNYGSTDGGRIRKVGFFHTNLTSVEVRKNGIDKWDDVPTALAQSAFGQYGRVAVSGLYMLDRVFDGNQGEAETTVDESGRKWNIQTSITASAADTIEAYADMHQPLAFF